MHVDDDTGVEWSWSEDAEMPPSSFVSNRTRALPPKLGDCTLLDKDLHGKSHSKQRFVLKSTDDRDWPICFSLLAAESTGFGPKRMQCSVRPLFPIAHG